MNDSRIEGPVYVTRWALTRGILIYMNGGEVVDQQYFQSGDPAHSCSDPAYCFVGPNDWTTDRAVAVGRVTEMANRKLRSLHAQCDAMKKLATGVDIKFTEAV